MRVSTFSRAWDPDDTKTGIARSAAYPHTAAVPAGRLRRKQRAKTRHHHLAELESIGARINDAMPTSVRQITHSMAKIMVIWRNSSTATAPTFAGLSVRRGAL